MTVLSPYAKTRTVYRGVASGTTLLTDQGPVAISTLMGQTVPIWNGTVWEKAAIAMAGSDQPLYRVVLSDGRTLDCSAGYPWFILIGSNAFTAETKTAALVATNKAWRTHLPTDVEGRAGATPSIVSVTPLATNDSLYAVESSSGLAVFNGILTSCGRQPESNNPDAGDTGGTLTSLLDAFVVGGLTLHQLNGQTSHPI